MTNVQSQFPPVIEADPLPPALTALVQRFVARSRRLRLIQSGGAVLAFVLIWTLAWSLLDRLHPMSNWLRFILLLIEASAVVIVMFRPVARLFSRDMPWHAAAARIEEREPSFGGGLQTALSQLLMPPNQRGSAAMLEQVVQETASRASTVDARSLLPSSAALKPAIIAAGVFSLMLVMFASSWLNLPRLLKRQLLPFSSAAPVTTTRLFVSPGPVDVIEGDPLKISVRAEALGDSQPLLQWRGDDPVFASALMMPEAGGYAYAFRSVDRPLTYRVSGGDATSSLFQVRVIARPTVRQLQVGYVYPDWTELSPKASVISSGDLEAPTGTVATVSIVASEALSAVAGVVDSKRIDSTPSVDPAVRSLSIPIKNSGPWHLELTGADRVTGSGPSGMTIHAIPPQPPQANLLLPSKEDELRLHPRDVLTLGYEAADQFALSKIHTEISVNSLPPFATAIPLAANHRYQSGSFDVDLAQLGVNLGDVISITLIAENEAGLHRKSEPCRIVVSPESIDLNAQQRLTELHEAARLAKVLNDESIAAAKALDQSPPGDDKEARDAQVSPPLAAADGITPELSRQLLRALAHSSSPQLSTAIAWMVDANQRSAIGLESASSAVITEMRDPLHDRLNHLVDLTNLLRQSLDAFWQGESAAQLLAESEDAKADDARAGALKGAQTDAVRLSARRARADEDAGCAQLGIDSHAADADTQLQSRAQQATQIVERFGPVDFAAAAREWSAAGAQAGTGLVARLTVASEAEAVRSEGDFIWARDLQLSARAARRIDTSADMPANARSDYPAELHALQQLNALRIARTPADQLAAPIKAADEARRRMRLWAGEFDPATQSALAQLAMDPERVALEAAAAEAEQKLEQSERASHATTMDAESATPLDLPLTAGGAADRSAEETTQPSMSAAELERFKRSVATARRLERLSAEQVILRKQTRTASGADLQRLASEQRALSAAIQSARSEDNQTRRLPHEPQSDVPQSGGEQLGQKSLALPPSDHQSPVDQNPTDQDAEDAPTDSREEAMNAIRSAQERLAEMPKEIKRASQAETQQHDAEVIADEAQQQLDSADPEAKGAAKQIAEETRAAADLAKAQATGVQVSPDEAGDVAVSLQRFAPEATPAAEAITQQLTPALTTMRQTQAVGDHEGNQRSTEQAQQAVAQVQQRLKEGLQSLLNRDALTTAKFFSNNAAQALAQPHPDRAAALRLQRGASAALEKAWDDALHQAAGQRIANLPSMASILRMYPSENGFAEQTSLGAEPAPAEREWGRLREQKPEDLSAGSHEIDPPEYQDALRVYFRDLANEEGSARQ